MGKGDFIQTERAPDTGSIIQRETPQNSRKPGKRMRGGQPGNQNAVTHGRFSAPVRVARRAAAEQRARQHREWMKAMPRTDYGAICDAINAQGRRNNLHGNETRGEF
jgi:hypothetical protein